MSKQDINFKQRQWLKKKGEDPKDSSNPLRIMVPSILSPTQLICKRVSFPSQLQYQVRSKLEIKRIRLILWTDEAQIQYKHFLGLIRGWIVHKKSTSVFTVYT